MSDNVVDIEDHIAFVCECGSVHFNLLKSGSLECAGCGFVQNNKSWHYEHVMFCSDFQFTCLKCGSQDVVIGRTVQCDNCGHFETPDYGDGE